MSEQYLIALESDGLSVTARAAIVQYVTQLVDALETAQREREFYLTQLAKCEQTSAGVSLTDKRIEEEREFWRLEWAKEADA
jgi:hypothetical protein